MQYNLILIGAGITNATIAALNPDKRILVLERDEIGGLCRTENMSGIDVHMHGRHVFHTNHKEAWDFVSHYAEFNNYAHRCKSCVDDDVLSFPINLETYSRLYNINSPEAAKELISKAEGDNFEDYLVSQIGWDLYDKFYKDYTEKLWGMPPYLLPAFLAKRIPIRSSYNDLYYPDKYQGVPVRGYTEMIESMFKYCDIQSADFLEDKDYFEAMADTVIYTGSVDEYFDYELGLLPYRSCEYTMSVLPVEDYQGTAQMNFPDRDVPYTRIIEHKHMNPVDTKMTIISEEKPVEWKTGQWLPRGYPIPLQDNMILYEDYVQMDHKAVFAGRLGGYKHLNMDECVRDAMILNETLSQTPHG